MFSTASTSQLASARLKWPFFVGAWLLTAMLALILGLLSSIASIFAVIVVVSLVFSALALFNYRIGVVLLVLLMPIANTSLFPHELFGITGLNPFNLLLLLTLMSYFLPRFIRRETYTLFPLYFYGLYLLPVLVAGLIGTTHVGQIPFSLDITEGLKFDNAFGYYRDLVIRPLFMLIVAFLLAAAVRDSKSPERFLGLGLFAVIVLAIIEVGILLWRGYGIFALSHSQYRDLLSVSGMHANQMGPFFAVAFGISLFMRAETTGWWPRLLATLAIGISSVAGMLTFSRGGVVIFAVVILIYLVSRRSLKTIAMSLIFVVLAALLAPSEFYERITLGTEGGTTLSASKNDELSAGRGYIWSKAVPDIPGALATGNGVGSFMWSDAIRSGAVRFMGHPHNTYLRTLLDFGLVGSTLLLLFFRKLFKGWRSARSDQRLSPLMRGFFHGVSASFVGYMIFAFTSSGVLPESDQIFLWLAMGILFGLQARPEMQQPCAA
jgi:O-antigen ligase